MAPIRLARTVDCDESTHSRWEIDALSARRSVVLFVGLLVAVRGPFYAAALIGPWDKDSRDLPLWMLALVFLSAPSVLAVAVRLAMRRSLRGFGWTPGRPRYLLAGLAFPIVVGFGVHGAAWAGGLIAPILGRGSPLALFESTLGNTLAFAIPIMLFEELAWRGFLVPELAKFLSFSRVALVSGGACALFHYPFLISPAYAEVPPSVSGVLAFTVGIVAASFPLAWLRLRSGSVWPAVLAHAAHNAAANDVLAKAFEPTGPVGAALVGESGWGLAAGYALVAWWCWRRRDAVERSRSGSGPTGEIGVAIGEGV